MGVVPGRSTGSLDRIPMPCALCQQDGPLRNSHVIPEWVYEPLYDEKHRFHILSADPTRPSWPEQKGLRERLLCDDCETKLSVWEGYARNLLSGDIGTTSKRSGDLVWVYGADYAPFKLFQLSILWRAGVSSLPIFSRVQLGPHQERLRARLLAGSPGKPTEYGCALYALTTPEGIDRGLIVQPTLAKIDGVHAYHFVFGGLIWLYFVSSHAPKRAASDAFIQCNGRFGLLVMESMGPMYVDQLIEKFHRARAEAKDAG